MTTSAYYFRAQLYTMVPHQICEDLAWMADHGTDAVVLGILEQDLFAAVENIDIICAEAERAGLKVWATPSRWGNLVAGCPKVPSLYGATHPATWAVRADGSPAMSPFGPIMSVHHPDTAVFFEGTLEQMLGRWPIHGVIWDELKALTVQDHSAAARAALAGRNRDDVATHVDAQVAFFGRLNTAIKRIRPGCTTACFVYGHMADEPWLATVAAMPDLDEFGLDGRPWARADCGSTDDPGGSVPTKFVIDQFPAFHDAATANGRRSLVLIENHAITRADIGLMDRRLPEILALGPDHLIYYYYPRSVEDPDTAMAVIGKHLTARSTGAGCRAGPSDRPTP